MTTTTRWRAGLTALVAVPPLMLAGASPSRAAAPAAPAADAAAASTPGSTRPGPCHGVDVFDSKDFSHPTTIDNRMLPLTPGLRMTLSGKVGNKPHDVVFTVTDLTKRVDGIDVVVVRDVDVTGGVLAEQELAFFAQDDRGRVWSVGEYPEEWDNGHLKGAPSTWVPGVGWARAGVIMQASPRRGTPSYLQGWAPGIGFGDCAKVFLTGQHVCVPAGCYDGVLVTDEWNPAAPAEGHQRKSYAPGVGNIDIGAANGVDPERLQLTKVEHLCGLELWKARNAALKMDQRAYDVKGDVWRHTTPATRTLTAPGC